jgi:transposase InsO family protein
MRKHQAEFDDIRRALASAPVLALRDPERDYILRTDASDVAIGGVLAQKQPWGIEGRLVERPLGFFSRKLHDVETRYAAYDRELLAIHNNLTHWEPYLGNRHTSVYTDHASLQHILSQKKLSSRQWRHLDKLQQVDCSIKYFPGAANLVADALSRIHHPASATPVATISINTMDLQITGAEEWKQEVRELLVEDAYFGPIVDVLREEAEITDDADNQATRRLKEKHHRKNIVRARLFRLDHGLLFRRDTGTLCIPSDMRSDVISEAHDSPLGGGHQGAEKTAATTASRFYWPHLTQSIRVWVRGCDVCHRVKHSNQLPYGLLQPLPIPETRASRVNVDFITKLPATVKDGYDCIITIVDPLTKRVRWKAGKEKDLTAEAFAKDFIDMWVRNRGIPDDIISDRDTRFMSDFWGSLTAQLGIKRRHSTAYHPQTDGQAENLNAVVERYLKAYVAQRPKEWDRLLPLAEFTYNAAYHKSLKTSPFRADIGFVPRMPIDLIVPTPSPDRQSKVSLEADEFAEQMMSDLRMLRERLEEAQTKMILEANKSRRPHDFKVGDSVFLDTTLLPIGYANLTKSESSNLNSRKFQQPFCGPFRITEAIGTNAFRLDTPAHWKMPNVFNVSRLKRDRVDYGREHPPPPPLRTMTDKDPEYEVEAILEHQGSSAKTLQYKVKWLGYPEPDWQPLVNLRGGCKELLRRYHQEKGLLVYKWMQEG